jgi:hypothetical protein
VLGGWRTLAMVQRYSHLAPAHLREAVERLVPATNGVGALGTQPAFKATIETTAVKHEQNLNGSRRVITDVS